MTTASDLSENLKHLCAEAKSVSEVCRALDINRQQFAKYLNGSAHPSPNNLRKISRYFNVPESDLNLPHAQFSRRVYSPGAAKPEELLLSAFRETASQARVLVGRFHSHYMSPSFPGHVVRGLVRIRERNGIVTSTTIERVRHSEIGQFSRMRFDGIVSMQDDTFFVVERDIQFLTGFSQTIIRPSQRGAFRWLFGQLIGYPWKDRKPYTSPCIWKQLREVDSSRDAIAACGAFPSNSKELDPTVVRFFDGKVPNVT